MLCGEVGSRVTSCGGPSGATHKAHHSTLLHARCLNRQDYSSLLSFSLQVDGAVEL